MSDIAMNQKLAVGATIKDGIAIGSKNIGSILVNVLLWVLTVWIPYLNVGTTIGLMVGIVSKASKGEIISPTEIFNPQHRKYMGEFFLTNGLVGIGVAVATAFFVIPGIVLGYAWSLAVLLAVWTKGKTLPKLSRSATSLPMATKEECSASTCWLAWRLPLWRVFWR